jgi:alcohol dehydrogenase
LESIAAVFRAAGEPLSIERVAIPELQCGQALIMIRCATICGSDLHSYYGRRASPIPCILGHEMVGDVVALGPGGASDYHGTALAIGDRVTWSMVWSCGECYYCRHALRPKCERLMKFGHEKLSLKHTLAGGMAEYCVLPANTAIFRLPPNLPDRVASPANCATATIAAVFRQAGSVAGQSVLIHGAGMLGLTACAMASAAGAAQVIVVEPDEVRRQTAMNFGATAVIDSALPLDHVRVRVHELTAARGVDLAIELSGHPNAVEQGLELLRPGGRFVLAGSTFPGRPVQLSAEQVVRRMLRIIGVYNYNPEDLEVALDFLAQSRERFPFEQLVSATFSLHEANAAFEFAERQRPARVAIVPEQREPPD